MTKVNNSYSIPKAVKYLVAAIFHTKTIMAICPNEFITNNITQTSTVRSLKKKVKEGETGSK